jgi:hypothetical protein
MKNACAYDQGCNEQMQNAMKDYFAGTRPLLRMPSRPSRPLSMLSSTRLDLRQQLRQRDSLIESKRGDGPCEPNRPLLVLIRLKEEHHDTV